MADADAGGLFGQLAMFNELITPEQLEKCLKIYGFLEGARPIGVIAVQEGFMTESQVQEVLRIQEQIRAKAAAKRRESINSAASAPATPPEPGLNTTSATSQKPLSRTSVGHKSSPNLAARAGAAQTGIPKPNHGVPPSQPRARRQAAANPARAVATPVAIPAAPANPRASSAVTPPADEAYETVVGQPAPAARIGVDVADPVLSQAHVATPKLGTAPESDLPEAELIEVEVEVDDDGVGAAQRAAPGAQAVASQSVTDIEVTPEDIERARRWLTAAAQSGASDLHLHAGAPPVMRICGRLQTQAREVLDETTLRPALLGLLQLAELETLASNYDVDFAYAIDGVARFRGNIMESLQGIKGVFRVLPAAPPSLEQLNLPGALARLTAYHQGLVLLTGPAGCGKSSTMAALVNLINRDRQVHVLSFEDPIEIVHFNQRAVVNQRQIGAHTANYARALRAALREDPDVIVIGEMRDVETISLAIKAAETGHLVLASMHTTSAIASISRLIDAFPPEQQSQIRTMVSESLRAICSQNLLPSADGKQRVAALELLLVTPAVSNMVREQKTHQLPSLMQMGRDQGMVTMDQSLAALINAGVVKREVALPYAENPKLLPGG